MGKHVVRFHEDAAYRPGGYPGAAKVHAVGCRFILGVIRKSNQCVTEIATQLVAGHAKVLKGHIRLTDGTGLLRRAIPQVSAVPFDHSLQPVLHVARFGEAMELTRIDNQLRRDIQAPIRRAEASLPEIREFFAALPTRLTQKDFQHGCLMANTGVELGTRDIEFSAVVKEFFAEMTNVMGSCLRRAVDNGLLTVTTDIKLLAAYLVTEFRTALMLAASGATRNDIRRHLEIALQVLR